MKTYLITLMLLTPSIQALAGPGAHGPGGEHLDAPVGASAPVAATPRIEASTGKLELLGRLYDDELSIMIDRFATNEPVTQGTVQMEALGLKAVAEFHADHGDFTIADPAMLKALRQPGSHRVVFNVVTQTGSDVIAGVLQVGAAQGAASHHDGHDDHGHDDHAGDAHDHDHDHDHTHAWRTAAAVIAATLLLSGFGWWRSRRITSRKD